MRLIEYCLRYPLFVNLVTVVICLAGVVELKKMNKEAFPAINFDVVSIGTLYPGASPKEVELYVTDPIEEEIRSVDGLDRVESTSIEGYSLILVYLDPDRSEAQKNKTENNLQRAVDRVRDLPNELPNPPLVRSIDSGDMPVLEVALTSQPEHELSFHRLHGLARELQERLEDLDDVKEVIIRGDRDKEFWIEVSQTKLNRYNIGLALVVAALQSRNINLPGGVLKTSKGELLVRTMGEVQTADELSEIVLRTNDAGIQIKMKNVGRVRETFEQEKLIFRTSGKPSVNLLVNKKASGDIVELVSAVKHESDQFFTSRKLNKDVKVQYLNDASVFVANRLGVLTNNGIIGIVLVLLTLLFFLSKGIAIVAAVGMPVALLACLMVMGYSGLTVNLLTMFGLVIVLGMLVDDAIIVAENIWHHYEQGESAWNAAVKGASEVFWPVTATILTTIAAFSPLLMISGVFGKFIKFLPQVVIIALIASLIEAMLVLPSHAYEALKLFEGRKGRKDPTQAAPRRGLMHFLTECYGTLIGWVLRLRIVLLMLILSVLAGVGWLAKTKMELILFPAEGVESFFVRVELPRNVSLERSSERLKLIESHIAKLDKSELQDYVSHIGMQEDDPNDPFFKRGSHYAQIQVFLTPEKDRKRTADQIIEGLRGPLKKAIKESGHTKLFFSRVRTGPPVGKPVAIRISGDDLDLMDRVSDRLQGELAKMPGVHDISDNYAPGKDEFRVNINEEAAAKSLLTVRDIALHVRAAIEGQIATHVQKEGERIAVRVRYPESQRKSVNSITRSQVPNQVGIMVPLRRVASFQREPGISSIIHRDFRRAITVSAAIDEGKTSSTTVNQRLAPTLGRLAEQFPTLSFSAGGEYQDTDESMASLQEAFTVALALIFIILATQFRSLTQPIVVMMAIPFAGIGIVLAFYIHEMPLSFLGMIGAIGLCGVVVNDSIILVDFINKARMRGMSAFDAAVYAGKRRFRAVWLTASTTVFGLLPLVYGIGGEDKFLQPAAVALAYGLIFGTVLVLFLIPSLYLLRIDIGNLLLAMIPGRRSATLQDE